MVVQLYHLFILLPSDLDHYKVNVIMCIRIMVADNLFLAKALKNKTYNFLRAGFMKNTVSYRLIVHCFSAILMQLIYLCVCSNNFIATYTVYDEIFDDYG